MYGRQMDASSAGLILLLGHGLQFIWAILIYYVGAFAGTLFCVFMVTSLKKKELFM